MKDLKKFPTWVLTFIFTMIFGLIINLILNQWFSVDLGVIARNVFYITVFVSSYYFIRKWKL